MRFVVVFPLLIDKNRATVALEKKSGDHQVLGVILWGP